MARVPFTKGHGLGNDYLVMEERDIDFPLGPAAIQWICHRNWGVGSDGILLRTGSGVADLGLRIFNPDGSEAEKSGNGLRIFAKYLWERGGLRKSPMRIETKGGVVEAVCHLDGERVDQVTVEMGRATFRAPEIPMHGPDREVVGVPLQVGDRFLTVTCVSVGNPHCVVFTEKLDDDEVRQLGPRDREPPVLSQPHERPVRARRRPGPRGDPDLGARSRLDARVGLVVLRGRGVRGAQRARRRAADHPEPRGRAGGGRPRRTGPSACEGRSPKSCEGALAPELAHALRAGAPLPFEG